MIEGRSEGTQSLDSKVPILFLPFRLETRFGQGAKGPELWVRVYPGQIAIDTHQDPLTAQEKKDGDGYWAAVLAVVGGNEEALKRPWRELAAQHGAPRAAWIVQNSDPTLPTPAGPTAPAAGLNKVPTAEGLPDFFMLVAYVAGVEVIRAAGPPIRRPLAVGLDTQGGAPPSDIPIDEGMRWLVDFEEALRTGMAFRIPISPQQQARGFDRIIVYGVRQPTTAERSGEEVFSRLLDHHHYTDGLSWAPQGAPTKNTQDAASAFNRQDPGFEISYQVERTLPKTLGFRDAQRSADLLGIYPSVFDHVRFSDGKDLLDGDHMATALWPATIGYFMTEMLADVFTTDQVDAARGYFLDNVRARGPISALRVGRTLYGVLPATSIALRTKAATSPAESAVLGFLRTAIPLWLKSSTSTPRVGGSTDPDKDLAGILGMDASSMSYRGRWALGDQFAWNYFNFIFGWLNFAAHSPWWIEHFVRARKLLDSFGYTGWTPKLLGTTLTPNGFLINYPTVQQGPLSETDPLAADATLPNGNKLNYIQWLRQATVAELQTEAYPGPKPTSLLYRLLRQSLLVEYYKQASIAQVTQGTLQASDAREKEFVHLGSQRTITRWEVLDAPEPKTNRKWSDLLHDAAPGSPYGALVDVFASLDYLADRPTAALDRLLTETLDVCSHRLDALITSIATSRLRALRGKRTAPRLFLGGYGWVEGLRPATVQAAVSGAEAQAVARLDESRQAKVAAAARGQAKVAAAARVPREDNGGYILAPSMAQATTAAVMRSAFLTHRKSSNGQLLAVDLSSKRVRTALWIMDAVRQGQTFGAVVGYQFEQGLHEAKLTKYQQAFRDKYQLVDGQVTPGKPGETAASQVVNGVALHADWKNGVLAPGVPWDPSLPQPGTEQNTVIDLLKVLDDLMDALGDLSVAEAVHQITHGNPARAGGILDAMSKGERPPDVQVLNTPRGGLDMTHRVMIVLGDQGQLKAGWSTQSHPRAAAEPRLNAWLSQWLPDPTLVKASVSYTNSGTATTKPVLLSELDLGPLDFLAIAHTAEVAQAGELEQRMLYKVLPVGATSGVVSFALTPGVDDGKVSFPDAAFAARAWRDMVRGARPLGPDDLIDPDRASSPANNGQVNLAEINQRAADMLAALQAAIIALTSAIGGPEGLLQTALVRASYLGVAGAIPLSVDETGSALVGRAEAVLKELNQRKADAQSSRLPARRASGAITVIRAVLGKDFTALPLLSPPDNANLQSAFADSAGLLGTATDAPARWLQQLTHIRPPVSRLDGALTATQLLNGTARLPLTIGQLPFQAGAPWIGIGLSSPAPPPGRLSLVAVAVGDYAHNAAYSGLLVDEWPERIPSARVTSGLAFHYEEPQARAPQVLLLAVCPDQRPSWDEEVVLAILNETLDLAKIRTVDLDSIQEVGQILPPLYFPFNDHMETISADMLDITSKLT